MKKYHRRILSLLMATIIIFSNSLPANAQETLTEWYDLEIVENDDYFENVQNTIIPRGRYIGTVITSIAELDEGGIAMRVDVLCQEDMIEIVTVFYLQKIVDGVWVDVSSITVSQENTYHFVKTVKTTGDVPAGSYRAKTATMVTHPSGQVETATGYSGAIGID